MDIPYTIGQFISKSRPSQATGAFSSVLEDVALGCAMVSSMLRNTTADEFQKGSSQNISGDTQIPMDVRCNQIFLTLAQNNGHIAAIASEELDEVFHITDVSEAKYLLVLDPLDGSNNLQINAPVATIFSVCLAPSERDDASILEAARHPIAAGICVYGLTTFLALALEDGVFGFTRDFISGAFLYTHGKLTISEKAPDVAINFSNREHWDRPVRQYVDDCFLGNSGPRGREFNTRWYASAAAELCRILHRGGIFIYPACNNGKPKGVLRKMYEAWPMAYICEKAGGMATDGVTRMLDLTANGLHEKTPFAMGSAEEIKVLQSYYKN